MVITPKHLLGFCGNCSPARLEAGQFQEPTPGESHRLSYDIRVGQQSDRPNCEVARAYRGPDEPEQGWLTMTSSERGDTKGDTHILHDALRLLNLRNKIVLFSLDLGSGVLAKGRLIVGVLASSMELALFGRLGAVKNQPAVFDGATGFCRELDVGVQGGGPAGEETSLDGMILRQSGLSYFLLRKGVPLKCGRKRIFAGVGGA